MPVAEEETVPNDFRVKAVYAQRLVDLDPPAFTERQPEVVDERIPTTCEVWP
jgi:hypothetical protein